MYPRSIKRLLTPQTGVSGLPDSDKGYIAVMQSSQCRGSVQETADEVFIMTKRCMRSKVESERRLVAGSDVPESHCRSSASNAARATSAPRESWAAHWRSDACSASVIGVLAITCLLLPHHVLAQPANSRIFETDLTKNLYEAGGEPQIAVNPKNPQQLAVVEQTFGSKSIPSYSILFESPAFWRNFSGPVRDPVRNPPWNEVGMPVISNDGGKTWTRSQGPQFIYYEKNGLRYYGSCDPMVAAGPDGTLYVSTEIIAIFPEKEQPIAGIKEEGSDVYDMAGGSHVLVYSMDWGKTWSAPYLSDQPIDRPWMKVDQSTGKVYVASTGTYDSCFG